MGQAENFKTPSMMSILINENTKDDGTILNGEEIAAATATLYIGKTCTKQAHFNCLFISSGGVDTVRTCIMNL